LNSRDRVFTALRHQEPDRVPVDFWITEGALDKLKAELNLPCLDAVLDHVGADLRYIEGPAYRGPALPSREGGGVSDVWGIVRRTVEAGSDGGAYSAVVESPLGGMETMEEFERYEGWPSADWYDFSGIEAQCDRYRSRDLVVVFSGDRTNRVAQLKPYMYLRGMENTFVDLALHREIFRFIVGRITAFYREYLTRILEAARGKIDIFMTGDDFGSQNSLLCSRETWKELLEPGFGDYLELIRQAGALSMHHSCGAVEPLIGDMADCGLDILQSIQPEAAGMDPSALKRKYGSRISFNGSLSIQKTLPFGTPEEVKMEVADRVEAFGRDGGFIIGTAHNIQPDVPVENVLALIDAYRTRLWY